MDDTEHQARLAILHDHRQIMTKIDHLRRQADHLQRRAQDGDQSIEARMAATRLQAEVDQLQAEQAHWAARWNALKNRTAGHA